MVFIGCVVGRLIVIWLDVGFGNKCVVLMVVGCLKLCNLLDIVDFLWFVFVWVAVLLVVNSGVLFLMVILLKVVVVWLLFVFVVIIFIFI